MNEYSKKKLQLVSLLGFLFVIFIIFLFLFPQATYGEGVPDQTSSAVGVVAKENNLQRLLKSTPVPQLQNSVERQMIARRAKLFDQPNKLGYVYLISMSGTPIGYYSIIGKMASLRSYLVPQERITDETVRVQSDGTLYQTRVSGYYVLQDADIDGTYGENIEGVFFFTDNGTYVEIPINGVVTPIYSDQPLPLRTNKLN